MLFSDAQYRQDQAAVAAEEDASPPPAPFDPSARIEWSPAWSLRDGCFKYFPTSLLYYCHSGAGADQTSADSNGCAAGNTLEEAIVQGFLELTSSHFGFLGLGWGRLKRWSAGRARWRPSEGQSFQELGPGGEHNIGAQGLQVVEEAGSGSKRLAGVPPSA